MDRNLFLVASGKGGVGKSTVSANLSASLAAQGHTVVVVDADITMRNLDLFFGLQDSVVFDLQDVCLGKCPLDKALTPVSGYGNLSFIAAPMKMETAPAELYRLLFEFARDLCEKFDYVILDCPGGSGWMRSVGVPSCRMICVATPDVTSLRDAEKLADLAVLCGIDDVSLVVNRADKRLMKKKLQPTLDEIVEQVNLRLLGVIPNDERVPGCGNRADLCVNHKHWKISRAFANVANRMQGKDVNLLKL